MSDEYVTDPELLKQLNEGVQTPSTESTQSNEYVADPELLKQLGTPEQPLQAPVNPADYIVPQTAMAVRPITQAYWEGPAKGLSRDALEMASILKNVDPETAAKLASQPLEVAKAYIQGHPWYGSIKQMPGRALGYAGRAAGGIIADPLNAATMPYAMSAYEQEKIRQNPNLPEYVNNPYAQVVRGETTTQAKAGEANRMKALASMPFTGVTPQERARLEEDAAMRQNIRKKAYEKVMGPVAPMGALGATSGY